jgi:3-hydroxymyristoyl/3-hydroxydecanoyl-(acyl carrier protein) dehydratase
VPSTALQQRSGQFLGHSDAKLKLSRFNPLKELVLDATGFYNGLYGPMICPFSTSSVAEDFYIHPKVRMVDRVLSFDFGGGKYGLGYVEAEKDIDSGHWAFDAHFKNDPVFPGTLLVEGLNQIQLLFAKNAGYFGNGKYILGSDIGEPSGSMFREQVRPVASVIRFCVHVKKIEEATDKRVIIVSDCDTYWQGAQVMRTENLSLVIEEVDVT